MKRVHLLIKGYVQGVAYRWNAQEQARTLGLSGWVRNLNTGEVEAIAEGPAEKIDAFVTWCRRGPPAAEVEDVAVTEAPAIGEFTGFGIRR
jgi:acylphosphatase